MSARFITAAVLVSAAFNTANAAVQLEAADGINILAIDGKKISSEGFFTNKAPLKLTDGRHQLLVQYSVDLSRRADDSDVESTDTFVLTFKAKDQNLSLKTNKIKSLNDIRQFNKAPKWQLNTASGQALKTQAAALKVSGFQLSRNYEQELATFNLSDHPAAVSNFTFVAIADQSSPSGQSKNTVSSASVPSINTEQPMAAKMLRYWYLNADKKTRLEFKNWVNQ